MQHVRSRFGGYRTRRRDVRRQAPLLEIRIDGQLLTTVDWSMGGFLVEGYAGPLEPEHTFPCELTVRIGGRSLHAVVSATVVRRDHFSGRLACRFESYDDSVYNLLERASFGRLRA